MATRSGLSPAPSLSCTRAAVPRSSRAPIRPQSVPLVFAPRESRGRPLCPPGAGATRLAIRCRAVGGGERGGGEVARHPLVRTLLVDNYDSYTYNIYQELCVVNGVPPVVVQNDEWTWDHIRRLLYEEAAFDNIVISPGPGSPACPADVGVCLQLLLECGDIPILGVCLGHQALGYVHGALVVHAPEPVHGRLSEIEHSGCDLFNGIPSGRNSGFKVVRYHSLVVDPASLPRDIIPIAWARDTLPFIDNQDSHAAHGLTRNQRNQLMFSCNALKPDILMGIRHSSRPHYGVQFHPESVATSYGRKLFENFKEITICHGLSSVQGLKQKVQNSGKAQFVAVPCSKLPPEESFARHLTTEKLHLNGYDTLSHRKCLLRNMETKHLKLQWKKLNGLAGQVGGAENIFLELYGDKNGDDTFWLDSSSTDKGRARFSFMGGKGGNLWKQVTFWLSAKSGSNPRGGGRLIIQDAKGSKRSKYLEDGFLDFLDKELLSFHYNEKDYEGLPFDFHGGYVGFIGYDLKIECGALTNRHRSRMPDACFFFIDNVVAVDHHTNDVYILSIHEIAHSENCNMMFHGNLESSWLYTTESRLLALQLKASQKSDKKTLTMGSPGSFTPNFAVDKSKHQYVNDVEKCLKFIQDGESYELCLTTQMKMNTAGLNALGLYLDLRNQNPAPYAAWLNFSEDKLNICCSSPERFLRLDGNGVLEAKPIKGTVRRGSTCEEDEFLRLQLLHSEKDQAENLMIVDLLRNDLGRVCESGTVHVPRLMDIESYATVHTLVSTIHGIKKSNVSAIDCVRAAFPGGSMTGAPKMRSMELLDSLECCSRGVYSGSIGFFSYNKRFDLNIVIRTIVIHEGEISIGAGGAVVAMSNPEDEYEEMLLKAKAPTKAVKGYLKRTGSSDGRVMVAAE